MHKILMIEDDLELAEVLSEYLQKENFEISIAEDPYMGLSLLNMQDFDLLILDLTLPGMDGLEVCKEIREKKDIPIIISSARHDLSDKVSALDNGADDYIPKPYNPRELLARIHSLLRRKTSFNSNTHKDELELKDAQMCIFFKGEKMILTAAEYGILSYLMKKAGGVVSREELIYNCEAINEDTTNKSIDVIIGRIRQKLGENPKQPKHIHAVRGVGYKFIK